MTQTKSQKARVLWIHKDDFDAIDIEHDLLGEPHEAYRADCLQFREVLPEPQATGPAAEEKKSTWERLCELLKETGSEPYFNPFYDSKNAVEFGRFLKTVNAVRRDLEAKDLEIARLKENMAHETMLASGYCEIAHAQLSKHDRLVRAAVAILDGHFRGRDDHYANELSEALKDLEKSDG